MRKIETDTSTNTNISSATLVGTYTADATRDIFAQIWADQIAGNGEYSAYLKIQRQGAGSSYVVEPKTTKTVASGVTASAFMTISVSVVSGDVVTAFIDGLDGDTTTPDITCEWWEDDSLRPATADRTLAVDASGQVTTGAIANNGITAAAIAADASAEISDAVWDELIAGHVIAGSAGATLSSAGAATDPLLNTVPGAYLAGTAGNALGRIGSGQINVRSIVANSGAVETIRGDSYLNTDSRRIEWTEVQSGGTWPTLTGATIKVKIGGAVEFDGVVITATGTSKKVGVELTATQSATIPTNTNPGHDFSVVATLTNGSIVTLVTTKRPDAADEVSTPKWTSIEQIVLGE